MNIRIAVRLLALILCLFTIGFALVPIPSLMFASLLGMIACMILDEFVRKV